MLPTHSSAAGISHLRHRHTRLYVLSAGKEVVVSRELDGKLYAGHETFEWLLTVISYVMAAEVRHQHQPHPAACRLQ